jgi:thymidylate synthase
MIAVQHRVADVRQWFLSLKQREEYVVDKSGCKMLEVVGATFIADEETIFGRVNRDYVNREIEWYTTMSRNVNDIPGGPPKEWIRCASPEGLVNSNYGWMVWSEDNFKQYEHVLRELKRSPESRRAVTIYTRPSMWHEFYRDGMSDFVCTNVVQYFLRDGKLDAVVQMRSNDMWAGYRNDRAWQKHVHERLAKDLGVPEGTLLWHAGSLHCYEKNFYLIDGFARTGRHDLTLEEYRSLAE